RRGTDADDISILLAGVVDAAAGVAGWVCWGSVPAAAGWGGAAGACAAAGERGSRHAQRDASARGGGVVGPGAAAAERQFGYADSDRAGGWHVEDRQC